MTEQELLAELVKLDKKLDQVLAQNYQMMRHLQRTANPVDLVDTDKAAELAGVNVVKLRRIQWLFTDGRPPEKRNQYCPRRWYVDEVTIYRTEGEAGVRRLRELQARN